ncbi:unnamed protein product [Lota lota]
MTSSMLRRQLKNLVQNYSEAEVKVREATSNDPWGPSSSQMADLSDLTYNVVACNEIMTMLWKRLKDDKNWRHIHKSLTLLEYLLKTGDERVLLKMKDNIYIVKALTEFRFMDKDGKDQGTTVREKAKVVLLLMEDDEKLKTERDFAVKTREKTSKNAAASSSDTPKDSSYRPCYVAGASGLPSLDNIPSVADLTASFAARKEERLRQEEEKKEAERRAKLTEEELQWEDAGKPEASRPAAWSKDRAAEVKPDSPEEPQEAADPWGAPTKPPVDPWGAPAKTEEDPFAAPPTAEDPFSERPSNGEDPFGAPKDKPDPFGMSEDDPFTAAEDFDFSTPKEDPFSTPKEDPFSAPKEDPFSTPKEDPFSTPKEDPFSASNEATDPFATPAPSAPKEDPFDVLSSPPKADPFDVLSSPPKADPFDVLSSPPKADPFDVLSSPPKADPFDVLSSPPKADPFDVLSSPPKADPFDVLSSPPKADPFDVLSSPPKADPFDVLSSPPKADPFDVLSSPIREEPFLVPTTPPKEAPFAAPTAPPKADPSDPFSTLAGSPSTDAWEPTATSPPAPSDPWGPAGASQTKSVGGDPWGTGVASPTGPADLFGDATKPDADPWGPPAAAPANPDDAWGSPAPPPDSVPSDDPFGDGASKASDPWGAPSSGTGGPRRTPSRTQAVALLGSAGAKLVDLDSLLSSTPQPPPPTSTRLWPRPPAAGALNGPLSRTIPSAGVPPLASSSPLPSGLFGSVRLTTCDLSRSTYGAVQLPPWEGGAQSHRPTPSKGMYHSGFALPPLGAQPAPPSLGTGMVQSGYIGANRLTPHPGAPPYFSPSMVSPGSVGGALQAGAPPSGGSIPPRGGGVQWGGLLGDATEANPFLI